MLVEVENFVGKIFVSSFLGEFKDELTFKTNMGETFTFFHDYNCCEQVYLEDICGDLDDILNSEILSASCSYKTMTAEEEKEYCNSDYGDWYFYHIATIKGSVVLRWMGSSNGNYSTEMSIRYDKIQ